MKNGASKHKFDLEAHNARKAAKQKPKKGDAERKKVLCPCGCNKMIDAALYKLGALYALKSQVAAALETMATPRAPT